MYKSSTGNGNGKPNGHSNANGNGHTNGHANRIGPPSVDDRLPPQNIEAEQAVLGAILVDPTHEAVRTARAILRPGQFWRDAHRLVFAAMLALDDAGSPVDMITLSAELTRRGHLDDAGGWDGLAELADRVPHGLSVAHHAEIVAQLAVKREAGQSLLEAIDDVYSPLVTADELVARIRAAADRLGQRPPEVGAESPGEWPGPIARAAYHGVVGEAMGIVEGQTESDPAAVLVQFLVLAGNCLGRGPHWRVEATRHGLNLFAAIVGNSSKARKGTSWHNTLAFWEPVDGRYVADHVVEGLSSGEGLIDQVRDPSINGDGETLPGVDDKRLLCVETEFGATLGVMGREGNSLSGMLRRAWDSGSLRTLTRKKNQVRTTNSHISIIGHVTNDELELRLRDNDAANGFANRFLWVSARRARYLPHGGTIDRPAMEAVIGRLRAVREWAPVGQDIAMRRDPAADRLWEEVYPRLSEPRPGMLGSITSRAEAQAMRLAAIYAALDCNLVISADHLRAGLAVWRYCADSAAYIFGRKLGDPAAEKLLDAIRAAGDEGLSRWSITSGVFGRNKKAEEVADALDRLARSGLIERREVKGPGRPAETWHATNEATR